MQKAKLANRFVFAVDGEDATRYLAGKGRYADRKRYPLPALVLMDYHMPKLSGTEVLQWLRAQPQFKELPVVILTSTSEEWEIKRACEAGANDYLRKPGNLEGMVRLLERLPFRWALLPESRA